MSPRKIVNSNTIESYWKKRAEDFDLSVDALRQACYSSLLVWAETHRKINGKHFSVKDYPYLEDIYMDQSKEMCVIKSSQCGMSEYGVNAMFWIADTERGNTYFVFPTSKDVGIFVQGRIDTAKDETPYLKAKLDKKTDNVSIKRFGNKNMYFTGAQKRTQVIASPADFIFQDEYDEHNKTTDITVQKRLNGSRLKMIRRISTPTKPGYGISEQYEKSSQATWRVKCPHCNKEIRVSGLDMADRWKDFVKEVDNGDYIYCCPHCKKGEVDYTIGKWVHKYPNNPYHGYSINRIMTKRCTANELMKAYNDAIEMSNYQEFLNSDLGVPYEQKGSRVYEKDLVKCEQDIQTQRRGLDNIDYYVGVDTGNKKHCVVTHKNSDGKIVIDWAESVDSYEELGKFFDLYNVALMVIDNRPEPTPVHNLFKMHGTVRGAEHNNSLVKPCQNVKKDEGIIHWNRYRCIDFLYSSVLREELEIPRDLNSVTAGAFYRHVCTQVRVDTVSEQTQTTNSHFRPVTGKKMQDHYLFALIFSVCAMQVHEEIKKENVSSGFLIWS